MSNLTTHNVLVRFLPECVAPVAGSGLCVGEDEGAEEVVGACAFRILRAILHHRVSGHDEAGGGSSQEHLALGLNERLSIAGKFEAVHCTRVRTVLLHCKQTM